jgi:DNA-binding response OmpR family regulator
MNVMDNRKRVLVIDDEPGVLNFIEAGLTAAGYEVSTATDGEEGLRLVKSAAPDVLVVDVFMRPLTGFEVLERLRAFSKLPVIVFTARNEIGAMALEEGASAYLAKPFKPEELVAAIEDVLKATQEESRTTDRVSSRVS